MGLFNVFRKQQQRQQPPFPDDDLNFQEPSFPPPPGMAPQEFDSKMAAFESQQMKRQPKQMSELQAVKQAVGEPDFSMDKQPLPEFEMRNARPALSAKPRPSFEEALSSIPQQTEPRQIGEEDESKDYEKYQDEHAHEELYEEHEEELEDEVQQQQPEPEPEQQPEMRMPSFSPQKSVPLEPIFVNETVYKSVLRELTSLNRFTADAQALLTKMSALQSEMYPQFDAWHATYEDIHKKLIFIDKTLFEKKS